MIVRSYTGRTMGEALEKVRTDLGDNALIIETRSLRTPGLLGSRSGYEVVASSAPDDVPAPAPKPAAAPEDWRQELIGELRRPGQAADLKTAQDDRHLGDELAAIRRQLARLSLGQHTPTAWLGEDMTACLEAGDLPPELIAECDQALQRAGDRLKPAQREEFLARFLAHNTPVAGAIDWNHCRQLMVVGPTGVGKTTSIAKLAGDLVLRQRRRVALVTIDTYRVGASDQLQAYAELLDAPFAVAHTPAKLKEILASLSDCDNVFIDTAGRNPRDEARLQELRGYCRQVPGLQVMLAAPATCGRSEFAGIVERFSTLPIEHAILTKLDENLAPGRLLGCLRRHHLPVNYVTTGQEVPHDFHAVNALELARMVFSHEMCPA